MAEMGKNNIMPLELAIQREVAYRKKVANLLQSDEFIKDLLPLQVQTSASYQIPNQMPKSFPEPSPVTKSRPQLVPPSSAHQFRPSNPSLVSSSAYQFRPSNRSLVSTSAPQFPQSNPNLVSSSARPLPSPNPKLVQSSGYHQFPSSSTPRLFPPRPQTPNPPHQVSTNPIPGPLLVPGHNPGPGTRPWLPNTPTYSGIKRKMPTIIQGRPQPAQGTYITVDSLGNMFCKLCQVPCSGPLNLKQHLKGHKHKSKLKLLQKSGGEQGDKPPMCELCQIWCSHEDALRMHLLGQKHRAKEQEVERRQKSGEPTLLRRWCALCQVSCMEEENFLQHLKGQKHIMRLHHERT